MGNWISCLQVDVAEVNARWLIKYLHVGLECDSPILEAIHHHFPHCQTVSAIWTRLVQQSRTRLMEQSRTRLMEQSRTRPVHPSSSSGLTNNGTYQQLCNQLTDAGKWANWERDLNVPTGSLSDHVIYKNGTSRDYVDQVIEAHHIDDSFAMTYVALTGNGADWQGWRLERRLPGRTTYTTALLYRKISGILYYKGPISKDINHFEIDQPDSCLWNLANTLTEQLLAQDQGTYYVNAPSDVNFGMRHFAHAESLLIKKTTRYIQIMQTDDQTSMASKILFSLFRM